MAAKKTTRGGQKSSKTEEETIDDGNVKKESWTSWQVGVVVVSGIIGAILAVAITSLSSASPKPENDPSVNGGWDVDSAFLRSHQNDIDTCDFPVINAKIFTAKQRKRQTQLDGLFDHPFVVRGMTTTWPAHERWTKGNFTKFYGHRTIKLGSESSIVYGGGSAVLTATLNDVVGRMQPFSAAKDESAARDSFTFDVSVLKSIPELARDFKVLFVPLLHLLVTPLDIPSDTLSLTHSNTPYWHYLLTLLTPLLTSFARYLASSPPPGTLESSTNRASPGTCSLLELRGQVCPFIFTERRGWR